MSNLAIDITVGNGIVIGLNVEKSDPEIAIMTMEHLDTRHGLSASLAEWQIESILHNFESILERMRSYQRERPKKREKT